MKKRFVLLFIVMSILSTSYAQRGVKKGKGGCFCDAAAKKGEGFYLGLNGQASMFTFLSDFDIDNKTAISPGFQIGANINSKFSIESGINYFKLNKIESTTGDNVSKSIYYLDIPISLMFRFPNDNNGIIPYFAVGGVNNLVLRTDFFQPNDNSASSIVKNRYYADFFVQAKGGINFVLSDNITFFTGLSYRRSIRPADAFLSASTINFQQAYSLEIGFNYHF